MFEGPLWDRSDDGLTYRLGLLQPATPDPIGRLLRATDQQWTVWVGYAEVKDKLSKTGELRGEGGDSLMLGVGRQWRWALPDWTVLAGWRPHLAFETGLHYADDSLPSNGTHFNFPVQPGFEWTRAGESGDSGWVVGVRWLHLSNANVLDENVGYDGLVFRIGRQWTW